MANNITNSNTNTNSNSNSNTNTNSNSNGNLWNLYLRLKLITNKVYLNVNFMLVLYQYL